MISAHEQGVFGGPIDELCALVIAKCARAGFLNWCFCSFGLLVWLMVPFVYVGPFPRPILECGLIPLGKAVFWSGVALPASGSMSDTSSMDSVSDRRDTESCTGDYKALEGLGTGDEEELDVHQILGDTESSNAVEFIWQVRYHEWEDLPPQISARVEAAFKEGKASVIYGRERCESEWRTDDYDVVFEILKQRNIMTGTVRSVRRIKVKMENEEIAVINQWWEPAGDCGPETKKAKMTNPSNER